MTISSGSMHYEGTYDTCTPTHLASNKPQHHPQKIFQTHSDFGNKSLVIFF